MIERAYRYRDFEIAVLAEPVRVDDEQSTFGSVTRYLCHVYLRSKTAHPDLLPLKVLRPKYELFSDLQDAILAGCLAGEAAVNAALRPHEQNHKETESHNLALI